MVFALLGTSCFEDDSPSNSAGSGQSTFFLEQVNWGRLVDVFDESGVLVYSDTLIKESLQNIPGNYTLGLNTLTGSETLTIGAPSGSTHFEDLLESATAGLSGIITRGIGDPTPFSTVARNGSIRLQFSELIDPNSVTRQTLQVAVGDPPIVRQDVRYIVKNDVVGGDGSPKGVIIIDPTISRIEEATLGIPQNGTGFPESFDTISPNILIRIPTVLDPDFGQLTILRNLGGNHGLTATSSDALEDSFPPYHFDPVVVRAIRSGNSDDPFNGFMKDLRKPELVAEFLASIASVSSSTADPNLRTIQYSIDSVNCRAIQPKSGDVFEIGQAIFLVSGVVDSSDPNAYLVRGTVLTGLASLPTGDYSSSPLGSRITATYDSSQSQLQLCWVRFDPEPENGLPARGIDPMATVTLNFSEPMDPGTVKSLETMVLVSYLEDPPVPGSNPTPEELDAYAARQFDPNVENVGDYIDRQLGYQASGSGSGRVKFGPISFTPDSQSFTLAPSVGFADSHDDENDLRFALAIRDGIDGLKDLAGNGMSLGGFVAGNVGQSEMITPGSYRPWPTDRYFSLKFNGTDENGDGLAEYVGQFRPSSGKMYGRSLTRFSRLADNSNVYVAQRIQFGQGIMTPLTPAGAVLQTCWPYHLLGFGLQVVSELNIDIEGMAWTPFGGNVFDDTFNLYSLALAHSERTPDDFIDPMSGYPKYNNSGLQRNGKLFDDNVMGWTAGTAPEFDEVIVTEGFYSISASNLFTSQSGNKMYPWGDFSTTYTWRDNNIPQYASLDGAGFLGGKAGGSLPPEATGGLSVWGPDQHRSIGVPLLCRFRSYPKGKQYGTNGFQIQIMVGSSSQPAYRVYSAGGMDSGGSWHLVVPDDPSADGTIPNGGYNTATGFKTKNHGPELYWQQVDFVVRISRVFTHWFPFGGIPDFISSVTMDPAPEFQLPGTSVLVEFRGSADVSENNCAEPSILLDANVLDLYGDKLDIAQGGCGSIATPTSWKSDISSLLTYSGQNFQFFQIRLTFVSNIEMNLEPELDAMGFAWGVQ